jgi:transcriptional regulator with XRE-family HTH domain
MADDDLRRLQRQRRGYWLRLARRQSGLTLKEVAQAMGYSLKSQTTIRLWELGDRDPSDIQLSRIAGVYKVPVEVLIRPQPTDEERLAEWTRRAIHDADEDGDGQRRRVG